MRSRVADKLVSADIARLVTEDLENFRGPVPSEAAE